jgi:hypothetical protein
VVLLPPKLEKALFTNTQGVLEATKEVKEVCARNAKMIRDHVLRKEAASRKEVAEKGTRAQVLEATEEVKEVGVRNARRRHDQVFFFFFLFYLQTRIYQDWGHGSAAGVRVTSSRSRLPFLRAPV